MDEKMICNHDERFKGIMFTTNGCLACELEKMISKCERLGTALDITTGALEGSQGVVKELEEGIEGILNQKDLISFAIQKQLEELVGGDSKLYEGMEEKNGKKIE